MSKQLFMRRLVWCGLCVLPIVTMVGDRARAEGLNTATARIASVDATLLKRNARPVILTLEGFHSSVGRPNPVVTFTGRPVTITVQPGTIGLVSVPVFDLRETLAADVGNGVRGLATWSAEASSEPGEADESNEPCYFTVQPSPPNNVIGSVYLRIDARGRVRCTGWPNYSF